MQPFTPEQEARIAEIVRAVIRQEKAEVAQDLIGQLSQRLNLQAQERVHPDEIASSRYSADK